MKQDYDDPPTPRLLSLEPVPHTPEIPSHTPDIPTPLGGDDFAHRRRAWLLALGAAQAEHDLGAPQNAGAPASTAYYSAFQTPVNSAAVCAPPSGVYERQPVSYALSGPTLSGPTLRGTTVRTRSLVRSRPQSDSHDIEYTGTHTATSGAVVTHPQDVWDIQFVGTRNAPKRVKREAKPGGTADGGARDGRRTSGDQRRVLSGQGTSDNQQRRALDSARDLRARVDTEEPLCEITPETDTRQRDRKKCDFCGSRTYSGGGSGTSVRGRGSKVLAPQVRENLLRLLLGDIPTHARLCHPLAHIGKVNAALRSWHDVVAHVGASPGDEERVRQTAAEMMREMPRLLNQP